MFTAYINNCVYYLLQISLGVVECFKIHFDIVEDLIKDSDEELVPAIKGVTLRFATQYIVSACEELRFAAAIHVFCCQETSSSHSNVISLTIFVRICKVRRSNIYLY